MRSIRIVLPALVLILLLSFGIPVEVKAGSIYDGWSRGPSKDPNYFMIAVWYQQTSNAARYKSDGINTYIVVGDSSLTSGLANLKANGMTAVLPADDAAAWAPAVLSDPTFTAWLLPDEVDNCQFTAITINGTIHTGWPRPCVSVSSSGTTVSNGRIPTTNLKNMYDQIKAADSTRPIHLGLGQGVANSGYVGRGSAPGGGWTQEYIDYNKACDITGFDIYPYVGMGTAIPPITTPPIDNLWYQAKGLDSLRTSYAVGKPIWNTFECTNISNVTVVPTPQTMKSEVYMSLIHGSMGIIWFVHKITPFVEAGLFTYPTLEAGVKTINQQVTALAPVLNTVSSIGKATASSSTTIPIDIMVKEYNSYIYIFAAGMRNGPAVGTFQVFGLTGDTTVNVLGESRTITATNGRFTDNFIPWDAHIYQLAAGTGGAGFNPLDTVRHFPNPISLTSGNKKARFDTIAVQDIKIDIYNSGSTLIRTIYEKDFGNMGTSEWDLKDSNGETVSAGIYYFVVEDAAGNKKKGKIALTK